MDPGFIAVSTAMQEVRREIEQLAGIDVPVLIVGECGTGKEHVARMIHKLSARGGRELFKVNCSALPADLLERELCGQESEVSSAKSEVSPGKFELANKSTLLLDDIAGISPGAQPRLLKVMREGEFSRIGSVGAVQCDVRVIAATDVDLHQAVLTGTLRADLYYRLNCFTIHLPPLRDHKEDVPYLLDHFMRTWSAEYRRPRLPITRQILETSASYSWPGNIRELENFVMRYLVLDNEKLALSQLDLELPASPHIRADITGKDICDLKSVVRDLKQDAERAAILQALERTHGNKQEAASLLHISLRALHYKVRAYGIESASLRAQGSIGFPDATAPHAAQQAFQHSRTAAGKILTMARSVTR
jgi:DNA-binding NtrC family response regulator